MSKYALMMLIGCLTCVATAADFSKLISEVEKEYGIPKGLLSAIATVESRSNPYVLNIRGKALIADSKAEAEEIVASCLKEGITNIDIGIMQVNYRWHRKQFSSVSEMLNPAINIKYAGELMKALYKEHGSWQKSVRHYHSSRPEYHRKYSRKVIITWLEG